MSHITASSTRETSNLRCSAGVPGASTPPVTKHCKWEREWLSEFKWKEVRAVQSCRSISVMTNLCVCVHVYACVCTDSQFYCLGLTSLPIHQHPSPSCCVSLPLALCSPPHRSFSPPTRFFAVVFRCVSAISHNCPTKGKQSGKGSVLDLFNLDQHRDHLSVHQASHHPGPASEHPSHTFLCPCMHGIIVHLFHLSVCTHHLSPDPCKLNKPPDI